MLGISYKILLHVAKMHSGIREPAAVVRERAAAAGSRIAAVPTVTATANQTQLCS